MKPFVAVARPHDDVLRDSLELDIFAANIWSVYNGEAPPEYQDSQIFESKTYKTRGLRNIVDVVRDRLEGRGGDPVIQLQTPFGGGKTHALIALYHMARDMGANVVVLAGDAFDASEVVLWEEMERQLTGEVKVLGSETSPGVDKIRSVLVDCQPVLILVDELLEYAVKAAGRKIGDSTLASQLLAFIQELSGAVSSLDRASLVVTLPSSVLEHYDENAERLFQQLSKVLGRTEKIYAPVADDEIYSVIRRRLFKSVNKDEIRKIVDEIVEKLDSEDLLPEGLDVSDYRRAFMESYPFQPEVIDVLYERWGSFPNFQRTRGVLRLLSLVVNSLKDSNIPFIRLSDFDLSNDHIKREFIKFIGNEYDSIIASDITGPDSGSKVIDSSLKSYAPYRLGTHIATTIFLYSFSGGERNGATLEEIKRSCIETEIPMAIISDTLDKMRERLFYLHKRDGLYHFSNEPNLIRIHAARRENVTKETIKAEERRLLGQIIGKKLFDSYIWPGSPADIPDNKKLKLVVCRDKDECDGILEMKGETPRVYKNSLIFLVPAPEERGIFENHVRDRVAWENIYDDSSLEIPKEDRKWVKDKIEELEGEDKEKIRNLYRHVYVPGREELEKIDLGRTAGVDTPIDYEIKDMLKDEDKLKDEIAPNVIALKYLNQEDHVETSKILNAFYTTPGEIRITNENVLKKAIKTGVKEGLFGLGIQRTDSLECKCIKEECNVTFEGYEIIIKAEKCKKAPKITTRDILNRAPIPTLKLFDEYVKRGYDPEETRKALIKVIKECVEDGKIILGMEEDGEFKETEIPQLIEGEIIKKPKKLVISVNEILQRLKEKEHIHTQKLLNEYIKRGHEPEEVKEALTKTIKKGIDSNKFVLEIEDETFTETKSPKFTENEIIKKTDLEKVKITQIQWKFKVPLDDITYILNIKKHLLELFKDLKANAEITMKAEDGEITKDEYERIKETFEQLNIKLTEKIKK
ncbi:MAG: hypothetical protein RBT32_00010 [Methanothermobacter sp.]|nr:hypothetical protein [Methanothermobacter sp.]